MPLTAEEKSIADKAVAFAKAHKSAIAKRRTDPTIYLPEQDPVSVFMAGSPGAGKTESSKALIEEIDGGPILRIDPDELREEFADYDGTNAYLFQAAVSILVDKIHDKMLDQDQSFLLDGTFTNLKKSRENVQRSLKRDRKVQILYVYQEPLLAWQFVQARECAEGRKIHKETFIEQYFAARNVVNQLKVEFGKYLSVDLLMKNIDNTNQWYKAGVDQIDYHIPEKYSRSAIEKLLTES